MMIRVTAKSQRWDELVELGSVLAETILITLQPVREGILYKDVSITESLTCDPRQIVGSFLIPVIPFQW